MKKIIALIKKIAEEWNDAFPVSASHLTAWTGFVPAGFF